MNTPHDDNHDRLKRHNENCGSDDHQTPHHKQKKPPNQCDKNNAETQGSAASERTVRLGANVGLAVSPPKKLALLSYKGSSFVRLRKYV